MHTDDTGIYEVIAEVMASGGKAQLVKDCRGAHFLRRLSAEGEKWCLSPPLHSDPAALAEARELFPEHLPFAALPVDAT